MSSLDHNQQQQQSPDPATKPEALFPNNRDFWMQKNHEGRVQMLQSISQESHGNTKALFKNFMSRNLISGGSNDDYDLDTSPNQFETVPNFESYEFPGYKRPELKIQRSCNSHVFYDTLLEAMLMPQEMKRTGEGKRFIRATLGQLFQNDVSQPKQTGTQKSSFIHKLYLEEYHELLCELACHCQVYKVKNGSKLPLLKQGCLVLLKGELSVTKDDNNDCEQELKLYKDYINNQFVPAPQASAINAGGSMEVIFKKHSIAEGVANAALLKSYINSLEVRNEETILAGLQDFQKKHQDPNKAAEKQRASEMSDRSRHHKGTHANTQGKGNPSLNRMMRNLKKSVFNSTIGQSTNDNRYLKQLRLTNPKTSNIETATTHFNSELQGRIFSTLQSQAKIVHIPDNVLMNQPGKSTEQIIQECAARTSFLSKLMHEIIDDETQMLDGLCEKGQQYAPIVETQSSVDSKTSKCQSPTHFSKRVLTSLQPGHTLHQAVLFSSHPYLLNYQIRATASKSANVQSQPMLDQPRSKPSSRMSSSQGVGSRMKRTSNNLSALDLEDSAVILYIPKDGFELALQRQNHIMGTQLMDYIQSLKEFSHLTKALRRKMLQCAKIMKIRKTWKYDCYDMSNLFAVIKKGQFEFKCGEVSEKLTKSEHFSKKETDLHKLIYRENVSVRDRIQVNKKAEKERYEVLNKKKIKQEKLTQKILLGEGQYIGEEAVFMRVQPEKRQNFFVQIKDRYSVESITMDGEILAFNATMLSEILRQGGLYECAAALEQTWTHKMPNLKNYRPSFKDFYLKSLGNKKSESMKEPRPASSSSKGSDEVNNNQIAGIEKVKEIEALAVASMSTTQKARLLPDVKLFNSVRDQRTDKREQWHKLVNQQHVLEDHLSRSQSRVLLECVHSQKLYQKASEHSPINEQPAQPFFTVASQPNLCSFIENKINEKAGQILKQPS